MRKLMLIAGFVVAIASSAPGDAQTGTTVVRTAPGVAGAAQTITFVATITAINSATREVTLKGPQGREITLVAGPQVTNFARMKVGDQVAASYAEALTVELKKGGRKAVGVTEERVAMGAAPGEHPAGAGGRQITIVGDVIAVDSATQTITLRGAKKTVDLKVRDPEQFKLVEKGDQVEATYTEAVAVAVEPVKVAPK